jgi:N-acetylglucosamine-6-phosphate deacetylase
MHTMSEAEGFFDLQVNGYGGVDFNRPDLAAGDLHRACERLAADGVGGILATITTEALDRMAACLANVAALRERDPLAERLIAGFHIEGPFINEVPGYRGAHPADCIRPGNVDEMKRLLDAAGGFVRLVTIAPERDAGLAMTRLLARQGVIVSAGHCDPDLDQLRAAIDAGLSMFTHLGNGCPNQIPRHDNIIQRALSLCGRLWLCFIGDGVHIPLFALGNYLRVAGLEKTVVVTDAVAPAGLGPGTYGHGRFAITVRDDGAARIAGTEQLCGAALPLRGCFENLVRHVGLSEADARRLTVTNPRRAIGLPGR